MSNIYKQTDDELKSTVWKLQQKDGTLAFFKFISNLKAKDQTPQESKFCTWLKNFNPLIVPLKYQNYALGSFFAIRAIEFAANPWVMRQMSLWFTTRTILLYSALYFAPSQQVKNYGFNLSNGREFELIQKRINELPKDTQIAKMWHEWKLQKDRKFERENSEVNVFVLNPDNYVQGKRPIPCME